MDSTIYASTNGVDRYISCLISALASYEHIHIHWISLVSEPSLLFHREEKIDNYTKITIPMPQKCEIIICKSFWMDKYNKEVCRIILPHFHNKENIVIHINTLNLVDLGNCIKKHVPAKLINHLHCIPWKSLYNISRPIFNSLYKTYYLKNTKVDFRDYMTNPGEKRSYEVADKIITVTNCAKTFLREAMDVPKNKITVIQNGMEDHCNQVEFNTINSTVEILFVGSITPAKGIFYILDALRLVREKGFNVLLHIAGIGRTEEINKIITAYKDISVNKLGVLPFPILKQYYKRCHMGIIASLHEQSSYVAIEMSMFGLPLITTSVDGLDEMFTDEENALKVQTIFTSEKGLEVDVLQLKDKIIELIQDEHKRRLLSKNIRLLYEEKFNIKQMLSLTVDLYEKLTIK